MLIASIVLGVGLLFAVKSSNVTKITDLIVSSAVEANPSITLCKNDLKDTCTVYKVDIKNCDEDDYISNCND